MYRDVLELREFYDRRLGQVAGRMIRARIRQMWPDTRGLRVLGVGFAGPYLELFAHDAERTAALMPAGQGVIHWPPGGRCASLLADEREFPFADLTFDRVLLVHAIEGTSRANRLLRECWRVMAGQARLLAVTPNRSGVWARREVTPFGHGHPYSPSQLKQLLRDNLLNPTRTEHALYVPPVSAGFLLHAAPVWERIGRRWFRGLSGVTLVEAQKQLYAATPEPVASPVRGMAPAPDTRPA